MGPRLRKCARGIRRMGMSVMHGALHQGTARTRRPGPVQFQMFHAAGLLLSAHAAHPFLGAGMEEAALQQFPQRIDACLLYTSDAADE